jgi:hypothetical protein
MKKLFTAALMGGAIIATACGVAGPASADPPYANCAEVRADGAAPIQQGDPGWDDKFDKDGDGIGCE